MRCNASFAGLALIMGVLTGCGASLDGSNRGSMAALIGASNHKLEIAETSRESAKREVLQAPRTFTVSKSDDSYSWDRARFFIENYSEVVGGQRAAVVRIVGEQWALVSHPASTGYHYEVTREPRADRFVYTVSCAADSLGNKTQADLNEGNFARFVREGQLEVSLLNSKAG